MNRELLLNSALAVPRMRGYRTAMGGGVNKKQQPERFVLLTVEKNEPRIKLSYAMTKV